MSKKKLMSGIITCAVVFAGGFAWHAWGIASTQAQLHHTNRSNFVGANNNANFQAALEDALLQADAFFAKQGADILYSYQILSITGQRGGFAFFNDVFVEIVASQT